MTWRIVEKWFNVAPWENAEYITDNRGEKFWVDWRDRFKRAAELHVWYRGRWVGVIHLLREKDNSITLADIFIREDSQLRGHGLGKAMLKELIRWAKENKFNRICGFIEPHDGSDFEYLVEWYKRQGFVVENSLISFET